MNCQLCGKHHADPDSLETTIRLRPEGGTTILHCPDCNLADYPERDWEAAR